MTDDETRENVRLTADVALFANDEHRILHVLLIRRGWDPYKDHWALPGGHVDPGEEAIDAAGASLPRKPACGSPPP